MNDPVPSGNPVEVLMVGIGGYGHYYLKTLLEETPPDAVTITGAVEPFPERCHMTSILNHAGVPLFGTVREFFSSGYRADLAVIASPIHRHVPQSIIALEQGCHVLVDKPLGVTVQEADELIAARDASGKQVLVGYQWSYSSAIQFLKRDLMAGRYGEPRRLKALCCWPRPLSYFQRNDWAGMVRDPEGTLVLDSPANNAMAHFLHNLFYLAGERVDRSLEPVGVEAELYRTYPIGNCDTTVLRAFSSGGVEILFYASHSVEFAFGPVFELECSEGTITFNGPSTQVMAIDSQGNETAYGSPEADHQFLKLFEAIRTAQGGGDVVCGPEAARAHTLCVNGMHESVPDVVDMPGEVIRRESVGEEDERRWVEGLGETLLDCYNDWQLPSKSGVEWAEKGVMVDLNDYRGYEG